MIVNQTAEFKKWMRKLRDFRAKAHILSRLTQVEGGNLGDFKSVGNGVLEMRIDYGPGYTLFCKRRRSNRNPLDWRQQIIAGLRHHKGKKHLARNQK